MKKLKKPELVEDSRDWWKWVSMHFAMLGAGLSAFFTVWPDSAYQIWLAMPEPVKAYLPENVATLITGLVFALTMIGRMVKQGSSAN